ncbi:MAG: hypothetical protein ACLT4Y_07855 [Bifidobacterium breve]
MTGVLPNNDMGSRVTFTGHLNRAVRLIYGIFVIKRDDQEVGSDRSTPTGSSADASPGRDPPTGRRPATPERRPAPAGIPADEARIGHTSRIRNHRNHRQRKDST